MSCRTTPRPRSLVVRRGAQGPGQPLPRANRRRTRTAELDAELADLYGHSPDTEVELDAIGRAFRSLPDDDRELLSLIAWEGLERDEIAKALGLSRNAVRIRLRRARRRLSRALAAAGVHVTAETRMVPAKRPL
ncbi:sigma-70 family RNA polymerase sigma factor [Nonomuraea deserti]|uniref:sigma-70 family RNA polymerase sigma factor n=1 Tax=Nonomuraea deserti TaxID=1848322 RepID=UPI001FEB9BD0|nr:sigma-70 family RNA polymerase sigma factor [Nonomuraea deserti]